VTAASAPPAGGFLPTVLLFLLSRGVSIGIGFAGSIVVTRSLAAEGRGLYTLLLSTVLLLTYLTSFGVAAANPVLVGRNRGWARPLLGRTSWLLGAAVLPLLLAVLLGPSSFWSQLLPGIGRPLLLLALLHLLVLNLLGGYNAILLGLQRFVALNSVSVVLAVLGLLLQVLLIGLLGWGVAGALLALLLTNVVGATTSALLILGQPAAEPATASAPPPLRSGLAIGLRGLGVNLAGMLLLRSDVYLVDGLLGHRAVGIYAVGVLLAEQILQLPAILNSIFFAKSASAEPVEQQAVRASLLCGLLGLFTACGFALLGRPFLRLCYGGDFAAAYPSALLVMVGVSLWAFASPLSGYLAGKFGYPRSLLWAQLAGLVVNIGINLLCIPRFGLVGAGLATAVGYTVSSMMIAAAFAMATQLDFWRLFVPTAADRAWLRQKFGRHRAQAGR
jgi:O-antigen/teichoic acid export membrane protein